MKIKNPTENQIHHLKCAALWLESAALTWRSAADCFRSAALRRESAALLFRHGHELDADLTKFGIALFPKGFEFLA